MDRNGTLSSAVATGRLGVVGAWLMVLYVVTIATAIMAFSAFQFQTALGSVEGSGHALTIGELESERKSFAAKQELINALRENVSTLETNLLRVTEERNRVLTELLAIEADGRRLHDETTVAVKSVASGTDTGEDLETLFFQELPGYLATVIAKTGNDNRARLEELLGEARLIVNNSYLVEARHKALLQQSDDLSKRVEDAQTKLESVTSGSLPRPELIGLFQQVEFFEGVPFGRSFATMPPALLILSSRWRWVHLGALYT